ncbi:MAG: hypothetical protein BWX52_02011 [Bacteroidetes bacterium ADurb.Bin013]|nr:MAG: hypothetical protein BWX52_02011 [Bacteroidetes bacterium ADurb.Bin013]
MSAIDFCVIIILSAIAAVAASIPAAPCSISLPISAPERPKVSSTNFERVTPAGKLLYSSASFFNPSMDTSIPLRVAACKPLVNVSCDMNRSSDACTRREVSSVLSPNNRLMLSISVAYATVSFTASDMNLINPLTAAPAAPAAVANPRETPVTDLNLLSRSPSVLFNPLTPV